MMPLTPIQREVAQRIWFKAIQHIDDAEGNLKTGRTVRFTVCDLEIVVSSRSFERIDFLQASNALELVQTIAPAHDAWVIQYDMRGFRATGDADAMNRDLTCLRIALG